MDSHSLCGSQLHHVQQHSILVFVYETDENHYYLGDLIAFYLNGLCSYDIDYYATRCYFLRI